MNQFLFSMLTFVLIVEVALAGGRETSNESKIHNLWHAIQRVMPEGEKLTDGSSKYTGIVEGRNSVEITANGQEPLLLKIGDPVFVELVPILKRTGWQGSIRALGDRAVVIQQDQKRLALRLKEKCPGCWTRNNSSEIIIPKQQLGLNLNMAISRQTTKKEIIQRNVTWKESCQTTGFCMACSSGVANAVGGLCAMKTYTYSHFCPGSKKMAGDEVIVSSRTSLNLYDDSGNEVYKISLPEASVKDYENVKSISDCET